MRSRLGAAALLAGLAFAATPPLRASSYLLYFELQGVAGYSSAARKLVYASMDANEVMQKPGVGFDYVQRFSGATRDIAVLAVQGRLAWNAEGDRALQPQLYNAYLKIKTGPADIWIGHNKPKLGLSDALDNHGTLLQPLSMMGFGFDRDWGVGLEREFARGSAGLSLTTGSGMALETKGTYLLAGRLTRSVLSQDNFSYGFSAAVGSVGDYEGYEKMSDTPMPLLLAGTDLTWRRDTWEHSLEIMAGSRDERGALAVFWRTGVGLLEESRLKLEVQPVYIAARGESSFRLAAGASYQPHPDWTLRAMASYDTATKDAKIVLQVYYYKGVRF